MAKLKPVVLNKIGVEGLTNIKIRLTHDGKSREIGTDYYIPYNVMGKDGQVKDSYENHAKLNAALRQLMNEYYAIIDEIGTDIKYLSITSLTTRLKSKDIAKSFNKFTRERIIELRNQGRMSYAESHEVMLIHVQSFKGDVSFKDINERFLEKFETYLKVKGAKVNTRRIYINNIRAVFNYALDKEVINIPSPFRKFKVKQEKAVKRALDISDIWRLKSGSYPVAQQRSVDLFMLILYLNGINLKDLLYLRHANYVRGRILLNRAKTNEPLSIKVFPEAQEIIEKWRGEKYLLKFLDENDSYEHYKDFLKESNRRLKKAFGGKISTYYARHTLSSIMANLDIPLATISATLGHTLPGSSMTALYITFSLRKVDEAMEKVISYVNTPVVQSDSALQRAN